MISDTGRGYDGTLNRKVRCPGSVLRLGWYLVVNLWSAAIIQVRDPNSSIILRKHFCSAEATIPFFWVNFSVSTFQWNCYLVAFNPVAPLLHFLTVILWSLGNTSANTITNIRINLYNFYAIRKNARFILMHFENRYTMYRAESIVIILDFVTVMLLYIGIGKHSAVVVF